MWETIGDIIVMILMIPVIIICLIPIGICIYFAIGMTLKFFFPKMGL